MQNAIYRGRHFTLRKTFRKVAWNEKKEPHPRQVRSKRKTSQHLFCRFNQDYLKGVHALSAGCSVRNKCSRSPFRRQCLDYRLMQRSSSLQVSNTPSRIMRINECCSTRLVSIGIFSEILSPDSKVAFIAGSVSDFA